MLTEMITLGARPKDIDPMARLLLAALISMRAATAARAKPDRTGQRHRRDTLEIHGRRIRLSGIDAPESDQLCRGDDSLQYRCGAKSANALDEHIAGRSVSCEGVGRDQYARVVAVCSIDGEDIAMWLVRNGLAFDWPRYWRSERSGARGPWHMGGQRRCAVELSGLH